MVLVPTYQAHQAARWCPAWEKMSGAIRGDYHCRGVAEWRSGGVPGRAPVSRGPAARYWPAGELTRW